MSLIIYEAGAIRIVAKYVQQRRGRCYFKRRIPDDVKAAHPGRSGVLFFSLKTGDAPEAAKRADIEARKQDALWDRLRRGETPQGADIDKAAHALLDAYGLKVGQYREYMKADLEPTEFFDHLSRRGNLTMSAEEEDAVARGELDAVPNVDHPRATLAPHERLALNWFKDDTKPTPRFSDALALHQREIGEVEGSVAFAARRSRAENFMSLFGDLPWINFGCHKYQAYLFMTA